MRSELRVGIDAHCLGQEKTGNETYTYNLVKHLASLDREGVDYIVYVGDKWENDNGLLPEDRFQLKSIRPFNPLIRIPIGFAAQSRAAKLDVFHAQYLLPLHLKCRTVLTVHDVLYERFPEYFTKRDCYRNKVGVRWSCERADHIITVSETSKRDLVELYNVDPERISVTYLGADACYKRLQSAEAQRHVSKKYGIDEEFILYVGAIQPRKNIPRLLAAFERVKDELRLPHKLVIVGPRAWLAESAFRSLENSRAKDDVIVTGYVPKEDLPYFYNAAAVFVYVSFCEGFGLPVIEAMACGAPTITSRGSSLEEIAGDAALLVDPKDEESIAQAVGQVLFDSDMRAKLQELGIARSKLFSCQKMAIQTREVYRSVML